MTTCSPSRARRSQMQRPIAPAPPVTIATSGTAPGPELLQRGRAVHVDGLTEHEAVTEVDHDARRDVDLRALRRAAAEVPLGLELQLALAVDAGVRDADAGEVVHRGARPAPEARRVVVAHRVEAAHL